MQLQVISSFKINTFKVIFHFESIISYFSEHYFLGWKILLEFDEAEEDFYRITSHSKTLTDNAISNFISDEVISGNMTPTLSDHVPRFLFIPNLLSNFSCQRSNISRGNCSKFKQKKFMLDHFQKVWPFLPQLDQQIVNFSFESFLSNINS